MEENKLNLDWCQGYMALKYHMEDVLIENNLDVDKAVWAPPYALFSTKYYNNINELNHDKNYDYCFIGSINSNKKGRLWVIDFTIKYFTLLGSFDKTNIIKF